MPSMDAVRARFERAEIARQKWPEELLRVDDFPRTASGKVQKFLVRQDIAALDRRE
jgi:acyl-CoA synthetase (AMP-forming)/AMP-acid ligase II